MFYLVGELVVLPMTSMADRGKVTDDWMLLSIQEDGSLLPVESDDGSTQYTDVAMARAAALARGIEAARDRQGKTGLTAAPYNVRVPAK